MDIKFREERPSDAASLLEYMQIVGAQTDHLLFGAEGLSLSVDEERQWLENAQTETRDTMLLAVNDHEIIGAASLTGMKNDRLAHRATLAVTVKKNYWHRGIGSSLLEHCIEFGRLKDYRVIELVVSEENVNAVYLYEKLGFQIWGYYPDYFCIKGRYVGAFCMSLYL